MCGGASAELFFHCLSSVLSVYSVEIIFSYEATNSKRIRQHAANSLAKGPARL
jgi:hypothetical protein